MSELHNRLYAHLRLNEVAEANLLLTDSFDSVDVLHEDGLFFDFCVLNNNVESLKILLEIAADNQADIGKIKDILTRNEGKMGLEVMQVLTTFFNYFKDEPEYINT